MKKVNVQLIKSLTEESKYYKIPLFDVVAMYANKHDLEPLDLLKEFDDSFVEEIKNSAVPDNFSVKKFIEKKKHKKNIIDI